MKKDDKQYGLVTRGLANMCHKCPICPHADKKPNSSFGKIMRWHRTWCPAYIAHIKIYGEKNLSK
jgi:hypothetical protein